MPRPTQSPILTLAQVQGYCRRQQPDAAVSLGIISNPFSRTNARTRLNDRILPRALPDPSCAIDTRTPADLDSALRVLLFDRQVNVLGLNGGDGTLHLGLNRLVALADEVRERFGRELPLPRLLFLNGGTLNIVSRATGTKGNPVRTVRRFLRRAQGHPLGRLPEAALPVLAVRSGEQPPRYGFVFGSEVVANALEMYALFGEGYVGLARFFTELTVGYALSTQLWQEHGWKLDAPTTAVTLDGVIRPRYLAAVAVTIDLSILKGVVTAMRGPTSDTRFSAKIMLETETAKVIRSLPGLLLNRVSQAVVDQPSASRLEICGGYTLDGEVFLDRSPMGQTRPVDVQVAPFQVLAVAPEL